METLEAREVPATLVGVNVDRVTDLNPDWMFTDAFQESRPWQSSLRDPTTNQPLPAQLDAQGWPTALRPGERLETILYDVYAGRTPHYPTGTYTARWEGSADLQWVGASEVPGSRTLLPGGVNQARIAVTQQTTDGIHLTIRARDASTTLNNPLRNMHLWLPDYTDPSNPSQTTSFVGQVWTPGATFSPFHPLFEQSIVPFSTLRFMMAQNTNGSDLVHWDQRQHVGDARQASSNLQFGGQHTALWNGIAPEYLIELANRTHANPWVNMPYKADADYVRGFAQLVHDTLDPERTVYVEWSNELWNLTVNFDSSYWVRDQANAATNGDRGQIVAREARADFEIWSRVFADRPGQLVRVVAGAQAIPDWLSNRRPGATQHGVLEYMNGEFDAIATGAYVGFTGDQSFRWDANTASDTIINAMLTERVPVVANQLRTHQDMAAYYSGVLGRPIPLLVYEGGPLNTVPRDAQNPAYGQALRRAERDPGMARVDRELFRVANENGVDLLNIYNFTDPSSGADAGLLAYQDQPLTEAARYEAARAAAQDGAARALAARVNGPAGAVREGSPVTLTASAVNAAPGTLSYAWTVLANGATVATARTPSLTFTPADNGNYRVILRILDATGGSATASYALQVDNVPPQNVTISGPAAASPGQAAGFSVAFTDPGSADTHTVAWRVTDGAGAVVAQGAGTAFSFTPGAAGVYQVAATVIDDDGGNATAARQLTVAQAGTTIDARSLGAPILYLDNQSYNALSEINLSLAPGQHRLRSMFGNSYTLTVRADGSLAGIDAPPTAARLDGSSRLVLTGTPVTLDATALHLPVFYADVLSFAGDAPATLNVLPGEHRFYGPFTDVFTFTVADNGTIAATDAPARLVSGVGTSRIALTGLSVTLDATAAGLPVLYVDTASFSGSAPVTLTVLPGTHRFYSAFGDVFTFTVGGDGTITGTTLPAALASGVGTSRLSITAPQVTIDARARAGGPVYLDTVTLATDAPVVLRLLPGRHRIHGADGVFHFFTVAADGSVLDDPSLAGFADVIRGVLVLR